ncbi:MAG: gliding motility-associated C-terminal domain-containing protein [Bacteroidales bacterium]|nr:gliding motility-associated C-terminal domain-containing protein [Bacteroidales bacterium]
MKTRLTMMALLLAAAVPAWSQNSTWSQSTACPGWSNPANFNTGNAMYTWSGQSGKKDEGEPDVLTAYTAMTFNNTMYSGNQLANVTANSGYGNAGLPDNDKQFRVNKTTDAVQYDPNAGGTRLKIVPTHFNTVSTGTNDVPTNITSSIRIGDGKTGAQAAALYYTMPVTADNAMLYLYYAAVVEAPSGTGHGKKYDPTVVVRVMKKNASGNWQQIYSENEGWLAYYVTSTSTSNGGTAQILSDYNENGWHYGSSNDIIYKDWAKVSINLSKYISEQVRIEVMMGDCEWSGHFGYAYIAGECRPMEIQQSGCPSGATTDVTTLTAPRGLLGYQWYASEWGESPIAYLNLDPSDPQSTSHYTFRPLTTERTEADSGHIYKLQAADFQVTRERNAAGQTVPCNYMSARQTICCEMKSAIDPAKPFKTRLYVNVENTKPAIQVDSLLMCDGSVRLWDHSLVPGVGTSASVDNSRTEWKFYNNATGLGNPAFSHTGDTVMTSFTDADPKSLLVRVWKTVTPADTAQCYTDQLFPIQPRVNPATKGMTISDRVLCDEASTQITDTCRAGTSRRWELLDPAAPNGDTTLSFVITGEGTENKSINRSFTHSVEPIRLTVYNGMYWMDGTDTMWCSTTVTDTVSVFLHPELDVTGEQIVCEGSRTDVEVRAKGVANCTYEWSRRLGVVEGGLPAGQKLQVVPQSEYETYYVKVTSPQGCVAWDSIVVQLVTPELTMTPEDGRICPGQVAELTGTAADHYTWTASPADPSLAGQETQDRIAVSPTRTTVYTMVGHGANDCDATPLKKTVTVVPLVVPSVDYTPAYIDSDDPRITMRDAGNGSYLSEWEFEDGVMSTGKEVTHAFEGVIGRDSAHVVLTSYNELGCPIVHHFGIPVALFTAWFPNVFTPDSRDGNALFKMYSVNAYEYFHIYIYNRRGELVYESDDQSFTWDGTHNGENLPQGTYVYTCRYRKPSSSSLSQHQGTVTLLR